MSLAPLRLTLVIRRMSLNRNKHRSFLIQGLELVVTRSCLQVFLGSYTVDNFMFTLKEFLPEPPSHYEPGRVSTPQAVATAAASPRAHLTLSPRWKYWEPVHGFLFLLVSGEGSLHARSLCVLAGAAIKSSMEEIDLVRFFHAGCHYANIFNTGNGLVLLQHNKDNRDKWKYCI